MPYISVIHSLKIDLSAHSLSEPFTENSFYEIRNAVISLANKHITRSSRTRFRYSTLAEMNGPSLVNKNVCRSACMLRVNFLYQV